MTLSPATIGSVVLTSSLLSVSAVVIGIVTVAHSVVVVHVAGAHANTEPHAVARVVHALLVKAPTTARIRPDDVELLELLGSLFETMKATLENGDDILIRGFGKFCVKNNNGRRHKNPLTDENMMLGAKRVVTFSCSMPLMQKLNGELTHN